MVRTHSSLPYAPNGADVRASQPTLLLLSYFDCAHLSKFYRRSSVAHCSPWPGFDCRDFRAREYLGSTLLTSRLRVRASPNTGTYHPELSLNSVPINSVPILTVVDVDVNFRPHVAIRGTSF